jgi:hypothetical protein
MKAQSSSNVRSQAVRLQKESHIWDINGLLIVIGVFLPAHRSALNVEYTYVRYTALGSGDLKRNVDLGGVDSFHLFTSELYTTSKPWNEAQDSEAWLFKCSGLRGRPGLTFLREPKHSGHGHQKCFLEGGFKMQSIRDLLRFTPPCQRPQ